MLDGLSPAAINRIYAGVAGSMHAEPGYRSELPLLICHGQHEQLGNVVRTAPKWVAREPRAEFAIIPAAGHNANLDNPECFNALVLTFLNRFSVSAETEP
jgi:pimeloyl-ACP methyl ester carboxylesterase